MDIVTALLFLLFMYAGLDKLMDLEEFSHDMGNQPVPKSIVPLLVYGIPISEVMAALLLLTAWTRKYGLYLSLLLMAVFTVYVAMVVMDVFPRKPCGCGELIQRLSWTEHLVFNFFFTALAVLGITINSHLTKKNKTASATVRVAGS